LLEAHAQTETLRDQSDFIVLSLAALGGINGQLGLYKALTDEM
jgi:hypothetical protein